MVLGYKDDEMIQLTNENFNKGEKVIVAEGEFWGSEGELIRIEGKTHMLIRLQGIVSITIKIAKKSLKKI